MHSVLWIRPTCRFVELWFFVLGKGSLVSVGTPAISLKIFKLIADITSIITDHFMFAAGLAF